MFLRNFRICASSWPSIFSPVVSIKQVFAFSIAMHKSKIHRFLKMNLEFLNLVICDSWFENRNEIFEGRTTVERDELLVIYRIVYFGVFFYLVFQTCKNSRTVRLKSLTMFSGALILLHNYKSNLAHLLAFQNLVIEF